MVVFTVQHLWFRLKNVNEEGDFCLPCGFDRGCTFDIYYLYFVFWAVFFFFFPIVCLFCFLFFLFICLFIFWVLLSTFSVGGDTTINSGPFHSKEVASKTWNHTISSYSLRGLGVNIWQKGTS